MNIEAGWTDWIKSRTDLMNAATDPNLKQHFKAEIDTAQRTLDAIENPPPSASLDPGAPGNAPAPNTSGGGNPPPAAPAGSATAPDSGSSSVDLFSGKTPNGPLSQADSDKLAGQLVNALMKDFGFTREQAAGIVGNLYHESAGLNPHVNEFEYSGYHAGDPRNFGPPANNVYGYGWAQWSAERKTAFLDFAKQQGLEPGSPKANYAFLVHELKTTESATVAAVKNAKTVDEAAVAFRSVYERAAMPNDESRLAAARRIYGMTA